ncbi:kelch-like protein 28 [Vigna radiata var. radiata]|uniref:Kelch-like protein 28 n=1 Tax=Vigna radiata var. radiata TaxID=3916 RepID=A0A1S3TFB1_VIGRR|nr:kelch-like protein 28 [Vigna radiata var. radiata]
MPRRMAGARKKGQAPQYCGNQPFPPNLSCGRNLRKSELGAVIFGCKNATMNECLSKQLFGLPAQHFSYVKNVDPGLPLFLFNYTDRKLHGIFEAASKGRMFIDPYGWTTDGSERTQYPAQVQICVRLKCQPLPEDKFKELLADNYYTHNHFWFELDHEQTSRLISLLSSRSIVCGNSVWQNTPNWVTSSRPLTSSETWREDETFEDETEVVENENEVNSIHEDEVNSVHEDEVNSVHEDEVNSVHEDEVNSVHEDEVNSVHENEVNSVHENEVNSVHLKLKELTVSYLEQRLIEAEREIQHLKDRCKVLESACNIPNRLEHVEKAVIKSTADLDPKDSLFLIGGFDGRSWLATMDLYCTSQSVTKPLKPMNSVRSYASVVRLNSEIYVFGGGNGCVWYDTVESYNPVHDNWTMCPSLNKKKGSLSGAALYGKIFAVGGGNGVDIYADVEMLDFDIGRWIPTRSMLSKRFALAAVELNGSIYATGGFDGNDYLRSAERFDPREHSWTKIPDMNVKRGCHCSVVLNEKLYALGGFDGTKMVQSIEVFDPRLGVWTMGEPMIHPRGYCAAVVVNESIFMLGGVRIGENIVDTVENYKVGQGWQETCRSAAVNRCFLSAIACSQE